MVVVILRGGVGCMVAERVVLDIRHWKDNTGKIRAIEDMDSMHLCFVLKQLWYSNNKQKAKRMSIIRNELRYRGFSKEEYLRKLEDCREGTYCMYPYDGYELEDYYEESIRKYYSNYLSFCNNLGV